MSTFPTLTEVKSIEVHEDSISKILILPDNRIATCSSDTTIKILDPSNDYHCDITLKGHTEWVTSICLLANGNIVSSSLDGSFKFWSITKDSYKCLFTISTGQVTADKIISLPNNRFAAAMYDEYSIRVYKTDEPFSETPIATMTGHKDYIPSIGYVKEKDVIVSASQDETCRVWKCETYQCINVIKGFYTGASNSVYVMDGERVFIGGADQCSIINLEKAAIEVQVEEKKLELVCSAVMIKEDIMLIASQSGILNLWNMKTNEFKQIKTNHQLRLQDVVKLNENTVLIATEEFTIDIYKIE